MIFEKWLEVFKALHAALPDKPILVCPNCGHTSVDYQYVADPLSRIGYLPIWCPDCMTGIELSRVKVPDSVEFLPFNTDSNEIKKRIPNFKPIQPDSD